MHLSSVLSVLPSLLLCAVPSLAAPAGPGSGSNPLQVYTISANNITASFIPYGARLTSLLVSDKNGQQQDIVVGYDDPQQYVVDTETNHTFFGPVVGRYANRIKSGTFELDGVTYHIPKSEKGKNTLHGGDIGYDQRNWTVTSHTADSITFTLLDSAFEGFPGDVLTHATYSVNSTVKPGKAPITQLTAKTVSLALTKRTPIMLANHIYWNLNGFQDPDVLKDTLHLPLSDRYIKVDSALIPTGEIPSVTDSPAGTLDFRKPKPIGKDIESATSCGADCVGYDNAFIVDRPSNDTNATSSPDTMAVVLNLASDTTGINMQVTTNQRAVQIYACNNQNGTIPVKQSQVARNQRAGVNGATMVNKWGCIVIETEQWIDGINNPQWGQEGYQIFSPKSGPSVNWATYVFGTT